MSASDMASGLSIESCLPAFRPSFSLNPGASCSGEASLQGGSGRGLALEWPGPELKYSQAGGPRGLQALLEDRIRNYQEAAASAKEAGEAAKARRCERGLKVRWARLGTSAGRSEAEGSEG